MEKIKTIISNRLNLPSIQRILYDSLGTHITNLEEFNKFILVSWKDLTEVQKTYVVQTLAGSYVGKSKNIILLKNYIEFILQYEKTI